MSKNKQRLAKQQSNNRIFQFFILALMAIGIIGGVIHFPARQTDASPEQTIQNSQANHGQTPPVEPVAKKSSSNPYPDLPSPKGWTKETAVKIYNGLNSTWEDKTYGDVGPGMEFIFGGYVYATTPEKGFLFAKPELDITKLAETDQAFDPDNWRMPQPDDIVYLFKSGSRQSTGQEWH